MPTLSFIDLGPLIISFYIHRLPPELETELFARVISFFGEESFPKIRDAFVVVVGLGGVGSHAAHMLVCL